ncbi:hypothetical protein E2C01_102492 [Portunus trituberculatus]|uniref:Uncharacterized protein n=1 Tax=Portunus trituberculatus TaxID=210409 RepID=A0A5B7KMR1_PORTR|nr:hypothetical protein [Portunus trituberculatus]
MAQVSARRGRYTDTRPLKPCPARWIYQGGYVNPPGASGILLHRCHHISDTRIKPLRQRGSEWKWMAEEEEEEEEEKEEEEEEWRRQKARETEGKRRKWKEETLSSSL